MAAKELEKLITAHNLRISAIFVPWSQSRNAKPTPRLSDRSLNWRVTLYKDNAIVLSGIDYSAGIGHCPSYEHTTRPTLDYAEKIAQETEVGRRHSKLGPPILPNTLDVVSSLVLDADVFNYARFEDWADSTGYDPDSRKHERIYRQCLEIALALRIGLGEALLSELQTAAQDY
jgi:hypothetical protein